MSLSKSFGRLFGELLNVGEEAAKSFAEGYKSARPKNDYVDEKTKAELKSEWNRLLDNTERIVNGMADKLEARRQR